VSTTDQDLSIQEAGPKAGGCTTADKCFLDMLGVFAEFEATFAASASLRASPRRKPLASARTGRLR
jgi:hypothetical protein